MSLRPLRALLAIAILAASPERASGQAFTAPQGLGSVTLAWQFVDNTGHRDSAGELFKAGDSVTKSLYVEVDYAIRDRLSVTAGLPYVFAKYTGGQPPFSGLDHDRCACWQSALQDLSLAARYRFGDEHWAITPSLRHVQPTHDYRYEGEAVVGRNLRETQVGVNGALRLQGFFDRASIEIGYTYSFVEKPIPSISINRSNAFVDGGYALTDRIYVHGVVAWQQTHGGLQFGSASGKPFFPPGEINTPERYAQRDRLISSQYWHAGAGVAFAAGPVDLFGSFTKYVAGKDTHDGHAYTIGTTWYFGRTK